MRSSLLTGFGVLAATINASPTLMSARDSRQRCTAEPSEKLRAFAGSMRASEQYDDNVLKDNIVVPTHIHIVTSGNSTEEGNVLDDVLTQQIKVMNDNYAPSSIAFTLAGTTRTVNAEWSTSDNNEPMKAALHKGDYATLNVYIVQERPYLGICNFPDDVTDEILAQDGCVIVSSSVPGGKAPYGEGKTATHEVGHWFGLFHTFQGGCEGDGDQVADTPAQRGPSSGCPKNADTCPNAEGADLVNNYMDYSDDACYEGFTDGQVARMRSMYSKFRAPAAEARSKGAF